MRKNYSNQSTSNSIDSPIDPLLDVLEARLLSRLQGKLADLFDEGFRNHGRVQEKERRLYSLLNLGEIYGVGRTEATRLIREGKLLCVERRCRGGRMGIFVPREEAERCFAGKNYTKQLSQARES